MVLRLLAFNAEAWLAEHFKAYLVEPNEYRAILRNLLHLGGHIEYTRTQIIITLDRPDRPAPPAPCNSSPRKSTPNPPACLATTDR